MTPQTAAALRALEQIAHDMLDHCARYWRSAGHIGEWSAKITELAAVLTQEGSVLHTIDFDQWFNASKYMQVVYSPDSRQPALDGWNAALARAAPAEPRAAEGAGTVRMMKDSNGDIHEECPDCRGECTPVECDTKPTAAAAVPAGGDAVAWRYWVSDTNHSVWHDMPVDQENRADCEELGYQVQYAYTAPAPRGGVTEAMVPCRHEVYHGACVHCDVPFVNGRPKYPPAAQAQDAGVKSNNAAIREHLRDDDRGSDAWWDRVHEKARALAAKEAK